MVRTWLIYGILITLPLCVTIWIVFTLIHIVSVPLDYYIGEHVNLYFSFLITVLILTIIGFLGKNMLGRYLIRMIEYLLNRLPIINTIYNSVKQIVRSFSVSDKRELRPVLIEYPRKGLWAIGFLTNPSIKGLVNLEGKNLAENKVSVLIPTTPNPTSGFFVYVKSSEIELLDLTVEECIRVLMSAGVAEIN